MKKILAYLNVRYLALVLGVTGLVAGSALAVSQADKGQSNTGAAAPKLEVDTTPLTRAGGPYASFAPVVKRVVPGVVKLVIMSKSSAASNPDWFGFSDPFWRRFFGDQFGERMPKRMPSLPRQYGLGSGVIVTKDGYILTNNHVVDNADEVKVTLHDGREFTAKVVGRDPKSDVAVIKIDAKDLPFVSMTDSDKVEVGDIVLAIGNPFGVGQTVTTGIVSATGRGGLGIIEEYEDFIQTDAAINPGNSGGALVDIEGRLIGINTAIFSRSGGSQGIGFAIPSNLARNVMESLIQYGHVSRGYLGVMIQDVTPALAREFKLKDQGGALIGDVVPKGPADKAGLKNGDVVLEFNGKKVRDSRHLKLAVGETKPGSKVPVKILREGAISNLQIAVQELPGAEKVAQSSGSKETDTGTLNGVGVGDLDQQAREELKVPDTITGVVVTEVQPDSPAAEAGLRPGDVIQEINRQAVKTADEAVRMTENPKDKITLLRIWSNGGSRYVVVDESNTGGK
ncbi:MAG TPA: DegQ family serine endoprotease [Candidatus Paceibacterota bacterium]|nr:DegQ family serine endoprotease [Verrucomicrobiota bacterium]HSA11889.1 DegQ family serine endoprotease [Candidatus Paceibacterota bacterium]